jgi:hypothetical protein
MYSHRSGEICIKQTSILTGHSRGTSHPRSYVRCLIRIMEMRHGGDITDSEWEELKSLGISRHQPTNQGKHIKWAKDLATMLTTFFIFQDLEPKEVIDMLFLVSGFHPLFTDTRITSNR